MYALEVATVKTVVRLRKQDVAAMEGYTHALKSSPHASSEEGGVKASCSQSSFLVTTRSHTTHARPQPNEILRTVQLSRSVDPSDPILAALRRRRTCSQTGVFIDTWRLLEK